MIDAINIISKGGILLWSYNFYEIKESDIRNIIKNILIEDKYEEFCTKYNNFHVKWKLINDFDSVIIIIYQGIENIKYLENLFLKIKKSFFKYTPNNFDIFELKIPIDFDKQFLKILDETDQTLNDINYIQYKKKEKNKIQNQKKELIENENDEKKYEQNLNKKKNKKTAREWELNKKITKKDLDKLDYSKNEEKNINEINKYNYESLSDSDLSNENDNKNTFINKLNNMFFKIFNLNQQIEENDIEVILSELKNKLLSKNVAMDICELLIQRVKEKIIGQKKNMFASNINNVVSNALYDILQTILIPNNSIDILRDALKAKSLGKVYSIVFLGVNGVGKSTNLAKVCYYLKTKGNLKIMIVACDTFRAGAVEQLKIHAKCLDVFLYEKGYNKDAANICKEAMIYAKKENYDVILIDTAGRMQDNEPLMRSLGRLVVMNNPDLIIFVGEALVGNDAIDQLKKFNQTLNEHTADNIPRSIDGIILTKFDTVDDKVGTALSMVYLTGKPIVFVGVGQKYTHLKKFNTNMVIKSLT